MLCEYLIYLGSGSGWIKPHHDLLYLIVLFENHVLITDMVITWHTSCAVSRNSMKVYCVIAIKYD